MKALVILVIGLSTLLVRASDPGKAAIEFLNKIRNGDVDLEPGEDTALKPSTSENKKKSIRRSLERLAMRLGGGEFELGNVRVDGQYAAALILRTDDFDDSQLQVFPVALVKEGNKWLPAPVLASFENAVNGYSVGLKQRLGVMEEWMMTERVINLERLIVERDERKRAKIRESVVGEVLEGDDLKLIMQGFLDACAKREQAMMLGYLGGLSSPWPDDWKDRTQAVSLAISEKSAQQYPWRLMVAPDVIRMVLHQENSSDSGTITVVCLDPAAGEESGEGGGFFVLRFGFKKDAQNLWRIELPEELLSDGEEILSVSGEIESELMEEFSAGLRKMEPLNSCATFVDAEKQLIECFKNGDLRKFFRLVDLSGADALRYESLVSYWWTMNKPGMFRLPIRLSEMQEGEYAVTMYQWFSLGQADRFEVKPLLFKKTGDAWAWIPEGIKSAPKEVREKMTKWISENERDWEGGWQDNMQDTLTHVDAVPTAVDIDDVKVRAFVESWLAALKERDLEKTLGFTAFLGKEKKLPMRGLRTLYFELGNAQRANSSIIDIYRAGPWIAVGLKHVNGDLISRSFLPVIVTETGLRVMPEVDLIAENKRSRDFLNRVSFDRLSKFTKDENLEILRKMFEDFKKLPE